MLCRDSCCVVGSSYQTFPNLWHGEGGWGEEGGGEVVVGGCSRVQVRGAHGGNLGGNMDHAVVVGEEVHGGHDEVGGG